jgi:hypothetical protein
MKTKQLSKAFWIPFFGVLILAALLTLVDKTGHQFRGWLAYSFLLGLAAVCIYGVGKVVNATQAVTKIALIAFFLRLGIGVALTLLLPVFGYQDNAEHHAGYFYTDSSIRDNQAWTLATSGESLVSAFSGRFSGDQYGGLLAMSAFIYRFLSPDAHRPFLILIINAAVSAVGVLALWKATSRWFGEKTALLAAWIFALYPESVLLGSTQMREAIIIPMVAISFFGLTEIQTGKKSGWLWIILSGIIMLPIQPLVALLSFAILLGLWFFDPDTLQSLKQRRTIFIISLSLGILLVAMLVASSVLVNLPSLQNAGVVNVYLSWFKNNFTFQSYLLERNSGIFQSLITSIGEQWRWLIILVYGVAQPVLPAIVGDPGAQLMLRIIGFLRAVGWYALVLFLIYGTLGVLRSRQETRRYQLIWISLVNWAWIMISALNAGADQWDNPRYRAIFLVWQVVLAAWAWEWARSRKDAWLYRWLVVELVFVGLFTEWYIGRYYPGIVHLDIKWMSVLTLVVCGSILVAGLVWDKLHSKKPSSRDSSL